MMRSISKFALDDARFHRVSLGEFLSPIKRAFSAKAHRRALRPLEDLDGWSDQTEVAFYEDLRLSRAE